MGNAHSYAKRHKGELITGGRLAGRGAGSWLPCPKGKVDGSVGLCQYPCPEGYTGDGVMFCKRPDYTKETRVLPPHPGICPPDRPYNISGLCYGDPPKGWRRILLGTLDQECPADKPEWKNYENFRGVSDIGVSCQRATYTRPPIPMLKIEFKKRIDTTPPPPPPLCSTVVPKHAPTVCRENDMPTETNTDTVGNQTITTAAWAISLDGDVYYKKCKRGFDYDDQFQKCAKKVGNDFIKTGPDAPYVTKTEKINYSVKRLKFCAEIPMNSTTNEECIKNVAPEVPEDDVQYNFTNDGENYVRCPKGYDYDDTLPCDLTRVHEKDCYKASKTCVKWAPMEVKTIDFAGESKQVNDGSTYHKKKLDVKPPELIKIEYSRTPDGDKWPVTREPIKYCKDEIEQRAKTPSKKIGLCMLNDPPGIEYDISSDIKNFYKKCKDPEYTFNFETGKCVKDKDSKDTELIPIKYDVIMNPVCSDIIPNDFNRDLLCRVNDFPKDSETEKYNISEDGEMYYVECKKEEEFYIPKKICLNRETKTETPTKTVPIQYGVPSGKRQQNITVSIVPFCSDVGSKTEMLCMDNKPPEGYEVAANYQTFDKNCNFNEAYSSPEAVCVYNKDNSKTRKPKEGEECDADETLQYTASNCVSDDGSIRSPDRITINYKMKQTDLCKDEMPTLDKSKLCRTNEPPEDYYLSANGETYVQYCADGFVLENGVCKNEEEQYVPPTIPVEYSKI
jgi:hypothetical protein